MSDLHLTAPPDEPELAPSLTWAKTVVDHVASLLARDATMRPETRLGIPAEVVEWLILTTGDLRALVATVAVPNEGYSWWKCNLCQKRGARVSPDHSRIAVSVHFSINHALVGREQAEPGEDYQDISEIAREKLLEQGYGGMYAEGEADPT